MREICNLVVGRYGYGYVRFDQIVDLSSFQSVEDIPGEIVVFDYRSCAVHPDEMESPPAGFALNVPATVTLENCWPTTETESSFLECEDLYIEMLKNRPGTEFIDYCPNSGTWTFKVKHFSTYSVGDRWESSSFV
jgi:nuclear pore complex protein Nup98-Nup96